MLHNSGMYCTAGPAGLLRAMQPLHCHEMQCTALHCHEAHSGIKLFLICQQDMLLCPSCAAISLRKCSWSGLLLLLQLALLVGME